MSGSGASMGVMVYDGDCGFCTRAADYLAEHGRAEVVAWQVLGDEGLAAHGLSTQDAVDAAWWLPPGSPRVRPLRGARALAAAARTCGPVLRLLGRLIDLRPVRPLAAVGYEVVARNRHRLPGGTPTCRMDDAPR